MKKILFCLLVAFGFAALPASASEEGYPWDKFPATKMTSMASLQNGARVFVNYCLSCHSAKYMQYNRLHDIGLTDDQIKKNLLFASDKVGDRMVVTLDPKQAKDWLGAAPPDLSVIARSRSAAGQGSGADYLYTYLRTFYRDDAKPTGWNNLAFPDVGMPHVLWELQGERRPVFRAVQEHGREVKVLAGWEVTKPGTLDARAYDSAVADLVAFMQWASEPGQKSRVQLGVWVLLFLSLFSVIAWRLNAAYWKDIK